MPGSIPCPNCSIKRELRDQQQQPPGDTASLTVPSDPHAEYVVAMPAQPDPSVGISIAGALILAKLASFV